MLKKIIAGVAGLLVAAGAVAAGVTSSEYTTSRDGAKVGGIVVLQSSDGVTASPVSSANPMPVLVQVSGLTGAVSSSLEGSHVWKAGAGSLFGFHVTNTTVPGYLMLFDAASVPADGAVTPVACFSMPSTNSTIGASSQPIPLPFTKGIVAVFSSTGCFTKTGSATAYFSALVQ